MKTLNMYLNYLKGSARVVVNCFAGLSRSSSCVIAYLILYKDFTAMEALKTVKTVRDIFPNNSNLAHLSRIHNEVSLTSINTNY